MDNHSCKLLSDKVISGDVNPHTTRPKEIFATDFAFVLSDLLVNGCDVLPEVDPHHELVSADVALVPLLALVNRLDVKF